MKLITFLLTAIVLTIHPAFGQKKTTKARIKWGSEHKIQRNSDLKYLVGNDSDGFFGIISRTGAYALSSTYYIQYINKLMQVEKTVELDLKFQKKNRKLEFFLQQNNRLYIFTSFANQKLQKNFLFIQTVDKNTLTLNNDIKKIAEIDYSGSSKFHSGSFSHTLSSDSTRLLIYSDQSSKKEKSKKYALCVLDNDMNKQWDKIITLPYNDDLLDIENITVDNDGNALILGKLYDEVEKEKRAGKPNYNFIILSYTDNGEHQNKYPIKVGGKFLNNMKITASDDNEIICAGLYSTDAKNTSNITGSFFLKVNAESKEITAKSFHEFSMDFITQYMTVRDESKTKKKADKGKEVGLDKLYLDNILARDDGSVLLVGEQYYVHTYTYTTVDSQGHSYTHTSTTYYNNDIMVIKVSPEGDILWTEKIPKKQVSGIPTYSSYALQVTDDKLYFIFNDSPKNLYYKGEGAVNNFSVSSNGIVSLVAMNMDGQQTREMLFSYENGRIPLKAMDCHQVSGDKMIIYCQKNKIQQYGEVTFRE